jgi:integrase
MTKITTTTSSTSTDNNNERILITQTQTQEQLTKLERKITIATEGLLDYVIKKLRNLATVATATVTNIITKKEKEIISAIGRQNIETICDYLISMNAEVNPTIMHKKNQLQVLCYLCEFHNNQKLFSEMTRNDILAYLDSLRRPEASDPEHKWIGTYNLRRVYLLRFFKWLYNPNLNPKDRPSSIPDVTTKISQLKRLERSTIKPSDLWTAEDHALFLKYCPSKRDKAYHTIARDSSCRPNEILKLRIRDVVFKTSGTSQYAEIVVNGKTGNRSIPLFAAVPYVKDWIDDHPQDRNPNAFLIPSFDRQHKRFGNKMQEKSLNDICKNIVSSSFLHY